ADRCSRVNSVEPEKAVLPCNNCRIVFRRRSSQNNSRPRNRAARDIEHRARNCCRVWRLWQSLLCVTESSCPKKDDTYAHWLDSAGHENAPVCYVASVTPKRSSVTVCIQGIFGGPRCQKHDNLTSHWHL